MKSLLLYSLCYLLVDMTCGQYSIEVETIMRNALFDSEKYSVLQRPNETVHVTVSYHIITINLLDIKEQTMSVTGYLSLSWVDSRLAWQGNSTFGDIPALFSVETYVWTPALMVTNSVDDVSVMSDSNIPMRIENNGKITWEMTGIFKTQCQVDITYYPFDTQKCDMTISSWGYTSRQITLLLDDDPVSKTFYRENGEWDLISETASTTDSSRKGQSYSQITFTLTLERRPFFHILNTLFPVILFAFLSCMTFKLPPDSGERMGYSLTVLLAYAVYLMLVSENIPTTSIHTSVITTYLIIVLALGASTVVCTIYLLDLHHKDEKDEAVSPFIQSLCRHFISKIACYPSCCACLCAKPRQVQPSSANTYSESDKEKQVPPGVTNDGLEDRYEYYTWKQIVVMLDMFYLRVYLTMMGLLTIIVLGILTSA